MGLSAQTEDSDTVSCGYCLEYIVHKRRLPCGHEFCLPCLKADRKINGKLVCVTCRLVHCLLINWPNKPSAYFYFLTVSCREPIADSLDLEMLPGNETNGIHLQTLCDTCSTRGHTTDGVQYCRDCKKVMCEKHQEVSKSMVIFIEVVYGTSLRISASWWALHRPSDSNYR